MMKGGNRMNKYLDAIKSCKDHYSKKKLKVALNGIMWIVMSDLADGNLTLDEYYFICGAMGEAIHNGIERR